MLNMMTGSLAAVRGGERACPDAVVGSPSGKGHLHSSMSAVVQELYSGLPAALSAESPSLSNPIRVLGAKPEASAFVRTCRRLPPEQQSTHGLKIRLSNYPERLERTAKASCPGLMDLFGKQSVATGGLVEEGHTPSRDRTQQDAFHDYARVGFGVAEAMVVLPVEDLDLFPLAVKEGYASREKEPRLIQEERDFPPHLSCLERADLLQNLEEGLAKVQVTPETLSDPMPGTQGMKADGTATRLFSQTGEGRSRVSTGVPLTEGRPCSDANTVMTKVTISGTNASLEPLSLAENPSAKEPWQGREECQSLAAGAPFPAAGLALSCLQSGGDPFLGQDEGRSPIVNACSSAQLEKMDGSDATPKISFDACLANMSPETSDCLFKGDLEFGEILWEETAGVQVACEAGQECEEVEFLGWASEPKKDESLSQTWSNAELASDCEDGDTMDSWADHTYSCLSRRAVGVQKVADLQRNHMDKMQEGSHPKKPAALQGGNCVHLESAPPLLSHVGRLPKDKCPVSPGSDGSREKDCHLHPWPCAGGVKGKGPPWVEASDQFRASTESQPTSHDRLEPDSAFSGVNLLQMKPCGNQRSGLWSSFGATCLHAGSSSNVCLTTGEECSEPALFCEELSFAQARDTDLRLLRGDPSRARATLAPHNASWLMYNKDELTLISRDGGDCATTHDQQEHSIDVKWGAAEDTLADVGSSSSKAHHSSNLCLATETGRTISGDASCDVLKVGTLSSCEEGGGLRVTRTCAPEVNAFLPSVCSSACEESFHPLNGVGKALNAVCSVRLSESCMEAETQKTGSEETIAESEGLPDRNRSGVTPLAKPQQEARAEGLPVLGSVGVEIVDAVQTGEGSWGSGLGGKHTWGRDLDETVFPALAKIVTDQSKEGNQICPTFSSLNPLCHLKSSFPEQAEPPDSPLFKEDFCHVDPDQPSKDVRPMETQLCGSPDDPLDRLAQFHQRHKVPEAEAFEHSPFPLVSPEKQKVDPVLQTVTRSAEDYPEGDSSSQRASWARLQKTQDVTLTALVLSLGKGAQETSRQDTASSSDKMASELTERRLEEDSEEMESFKPFPGCLESPLGPLKWTFLLKDQPHQGKAEEIFSASKVVFGIPSEAGGGNWFLKCNRELSPGQTRFQPSLPTFIPIKDQKRTEEVWGESFRSKEVSRWTCVDLSIRSLQSPGSCLSPEGEPLPSLSSKAPLSPKVEGHPSGPLLVKSGAFPFEAEMEAQPPHDCFPGGTSKRDFLPVAKALSGATEDVKRHKEKLSRPVQLFPRRNPPEILSRSSASDFQDGILSEASTLRLRTGRRRWQAVGAGLKRTGGHKLLESCLGSCVTDASVKATRTFGLGGCPKPTGEPLEVEQRVTPVGALRDARSPENRAKRMEMSTTGILEQRILAPRNSVGSASLGRILKLKGLGRHTPCAKSLVGNREHGGLCSTSREPERPARSMDMFETRHTGAKTLGFGFRTSVQPPVRTGGLPPLSSMLSKPAGFSRWESRSMFDGSGRVRSTRPFGRQPAKAPGKARLAPSPTFLKNPSGMVPRDRAEALDPVGALRIKRTTIWNHTPRVAHSRRLDPFRLSRRTKDPKLFRELSTLADTLLAPPRNPHKFRPRLPSSALLPVPEKYGHQRSPTLPEIFSCINIEFNSPWLRGSGCWFQMFSSQRAARGSVESTQMCFFGLDSKAPWVFGAPAFPVSFRIQVDPSSTKNFLGQESLLDVSKRLVVGEAPAGQASGWTFSFLLSQSHLDVEPRQKNAHFPPAPAKAWGADITAQNNAHGLQTILALLSPGFCRLWRKRWHSAHRALGIQTLTLLQLTRSLRGFKEASLPVPAGLASSTPYALGKALSLWSRQQQEPPSRASPAPAPLPLLPAGSRCHWRPAPTAPANLSLRSNSRAVWPPVRGQVIEASLAVKEEEPRWKLPFPRLVPRSCRGTELPQPRLGLSATEFQIRCLDELNASAPALLPKSEKAKLEKRPQKVSQIRIRKTIPKPDPNLTPMGLPRPKRLKKTEFSLEEIYTNKNYKSPPATRCLETIFEEPKERNGSLVAISHQKRKRVLEFQDFTIPRKRKARSRVKVVGSFTRAQKAALEGRELDVLLIQRLTDLETFFAEQEKGAAS